MRYADDTAVYTVRDWKELQMKMETDLIGIVDQFIHKLRTVNFAKTFFNTLFELQN